MKILQQVRENILPDEPRAAGSVRAVLAPGAEVVSACDALPACPPDGEVCLPCKVLLGCPAIPVAQICVVYVAEVQSQTLVRVPDRPAERTHIRNATQQQKITKKATQDRNERKASSVTLCTRGSHPR